MNLNIWRSDKHMHLLCMEIHWRYIIKLLKNFWFNESFFFMPVCRGRDHDQLRFQLHCGPFLGSRRSGMRFFKPSFCIYVSMLKSFVFILTSSPIDWNSPALLLLLLLVLLLSVMPTFLPCDFPSALWHSCCLCSCSSYFINTRWAPPSRRSQTTSTTFGRCAGAAATTSASARTTTAL